MRVELAILVNRKLRFFVLDKQVVTCCCSVDELSTIKKGNPVNKVGLRVNEPRWVSPVGNWSKVTNFYL